MLALLWILGVAFSSPASASCIRDNCLRAFRATNPTDQYQSAVEFCSTFTTSTITATASLPPFAATPCANNVARASSACSCMPTPVATASPACSQLIQNGNWGEGPTQSPNIPHWVVTTQNRGNGVFYETQNFGGGETGNCFWTKWENDYPPQPNEKVYINIAQRFSRCVGVPYRLSVSPFFLDGYYDANYPNQLPITLELAVGFNGSTPIASRKIVYPNNRSGGGEVTDSGELLMLLGPLSAAPAPGTDGLSITLSDSLGGDMELYLYNVTLTAMSN